MSESISTKPTSGLKEILQVAWPASVSMLARTLTQFIDGTMVARLGPATISAQGIGGLVAFVPESFSIGVLSLVNTYVSQNMGAGRLQRCGTYAYAGLGVAMLLSLLICPLAIFARPIFAAFGHSPEIQVLEAVYFRYMILSVPLTMSIRVLESFFYGLHKSGIVFVASAIANACNIFGNWVLIFGKFGFPAMGLEGAAIATVASWVLQFAILSAVFLSRPMHERFGTWLARATHMAQCRQLLAVGWPAGVSFLIDLSSWTVFTAVLIGHFGTQHLTAATAAIRWMGMSFMPSVGISIATTAIVGKYIGMGKRDIARKRAHTAMWTAMTYMGFCGIAFLLLRHEMVAMFIHVSPEQAAEGLDRAEMIAIGGRIMICAAVFQLFDALGIVFSGALKGAGDTLWPMIARGIIVLVVLVGGGTAMVRYLPQLTSLGPYIAATAYIILSGIAVAWRFESGAWRKIDLLKRTKSQRR